MAVWTPGGRVLLAGMGKKTEFGHRKARNIGARVMAALSKKNGLALTVRFTSGWSSERILDFAEGMMLRDYEFLEHQGIDDEHVTLDGNHPMAGHDLTFALQLVEIL